MTSLWYVWCVLRRELGAYLRSPGGYVIVAVVLAIDGLTFNALALPGTVASTYVFQTFLLWHSGWSATAAVFVAMRLIAEERQTGTLIMLVTSPLREWHVVLGKFLGGVVFLLVLNAISLYMPLLVFLHGRIALGHIAAGYLGVMLFASTALALGLVCSAVAPNQLMAVILGGAVVGAFVLLWAVAKTASPPIDAVVAYLSLHDKHFRPFMRGIVSVKDVVFYLTLIYFSLTVAAGMLEARRWR
jgi:ABC-2 type transport system permease protein